MELMEQLRQEAYAAACEILELAQLKKESIFVVGCSTSEILGSMIGTQSTPSAAKAVFDGIYQASNEHGVYLAAQCCEHLNRAVIIEQAAAQRYGLEEVNVIPQPKAGGSFATAAWAGFEAPTAVEHIRAHAGMDIGDTLIGMHLKNVAVPVRIHQKQIGQAHVVCARSRAKFIGGSRAIYDPEKL